MYSIRHSLGVFFAAVAVFALAATGVAAASPGHARGDHHLGSPGHLPPPPHRPPPTRGPEAPSSSRPTTSPATRSSPTTATPTARLTQAGSLHDRRPRRRARRLGRRPPRLAGLAGLRPRRTGCSTPSTRAATRSPCSRSTATGCICRQVAPLRRRRSRSASPRTATSSTCSTRAAAARSRATCAIGASCVPVPGSGTAPSAWTRPPRPSSPTPPARSPSPPTARSWSSPPRPTATPSTSSPSTASAALPPHAGGRPRARRRAVRASPSTPRGHARWSPRPARTRSPRSRIAADGTLTPARPASPPARPRPAGSPQADGRVLRVQRGQRHRLELRDAAGSLTALGNTATDAGTVDAAASPDGRFLYVQTGADGIVDEFRSTRRHAHPDRLGHRPGRRRRRGHRRLLTHPSPRPAAPRGAVGRGGGRAGDGASAGPVTAHLAEAVSRRESAGDQAHRAADDRPRRDRSAAEDLPDEGEPLGDREGEHRAQRDAEEKVRGDAWSLHGSNL